MDLRLFLFSASFRALFLVRFDLWNFPAQIAGTGSRPLARRPRDVESKQRFSFVGFFRIVADVCPLHHSVDLGELAAQTVFV